MKTVKYHKMNEKEFIKIKSLLDAGVKPVMVIDVTGKSSGTVSNINRSATFAQYQAFVRSYTTKSIEKRAHVDPEPILHTGDASHLELINALVAINKTLERLVEAWEQTPQGQLTGRANNGVEATYTSQPEL